MSTLLETPPRPDYAPPSLIPLGSLQALTKGAGPGGRRIVMLTGPALAVPGRSTDAERPIVVAGSRTA
jgi:hypothetical protein